MDILAGEMDQVMSRMQKADEAANFYGGCGPRLNEERDPSYWVEPTRLAESQIGQRKAERCNC